MYYPTSLFCYSFSVKLDRPYILYLEDILAGLLGEVHPPINGASPRPSVPRRQIQDGRKKLIGSFLVVSRCYVLARESESKVVQQ